MSNKLCLKCGLWNENHICSKKCLDALYDAYNNTTCDFNIDTRQYHTREYINTCRSLVDLKVNQYLNHCFTLIHWYITTKSSKEMRSDELELHTTAILIELAVAEQYLDPYRNHPKVIKYWETHLFNKGDKNENKALS